MKKVYLSDNGPVVSDSIYSFWRWNNTADLTIDRVKEIVTYALSLGINAFDLSPAYGQGKIEKLFGQAIRELDIEREKIVIFSKIGIRSFAEDGSEVISALTEKTINQQIASSLEQLNTNYIDVLLVQEFDPLMKIDEVASALTSLQLRNKVKHIGVADFSAEEQKLLATRLPNGLVTSHFEFNLLEIKPLEDGRVILAKEQYSKPMAFGPLADGQILKGTDEKAVAIRHALESLTTKYGSNIEQIAVAWIHALGALPIIGSLDKDRIKNAATASSIQLSHEDWHTLYSLSKKK